MLSPTELPVDPPLFGNSLCISKGIFQRAADLEIPRLIDARGSSLAKTASPKSSIADLISIKIHNLLQKVCHVH